MNSRGASLPTAYTLAVPIWPVRACGSERGSESEAVCSCVCPFLDHGVPQAEFVLVSPPWIEL